MIDIPLQLTETLPYVEIRILGCTQLPCPTNGWTLPIVRTDNTNALPAHRDGYEVQGIAPSNAFFKLEAELK